MKRQGLKTPLVVSGLFFCTLLVAAAAAFGQISRTDISRSTVTRNEDAGRIEALPGHWLKTAEDSSYKVPNLVITKPSSEFAGVPAMLTLDEATTGLNRGTDTVNVMYIWTDGDILKVISITSFNRATRHAAVVVIPLHTVVNNGRLVDLKGTYDTLQELYRSGGREAIRRCFEQKLEVRIPNFVHVNQPALQKISDIVGVLEVNGGRTSMLQAFEQTRAGLRTDDRDVVRAVAAQIMQPRMLLEVPRLLWIFTHDIETNFTAEQMVQLFGLSRQMDLLHMRKTALPGREYITGRGKYLFVSDQVWHNVLYEITT